MLSETMIWSGCSIPFGSGMISNDWLGPTNNVSIVADVESYDRMEDPVVWSHPKFYELFPDVKTHGESIEVVKQISYPMQLGKRLGMDTYNLSIPGFGIESQLRTVSSFILNNKDKIDYTKTMFCYQIPSLSRVELLNYSEHKLSGIKQSKSFSFSGTTLPKDFLLKHFHVDFYTAKYLMKMVEYRGFLESRGIKVFFFDMFKRTIDRNWYVSKSDQFMINNMLSFTNLKFPSQKSILKELDIQSIVDADDIETLAEAGFNDDSHFSPKGHTQVADIYEKFLREKLQ
jgi:hypothetical protein